MTVSPTTLVNESAESTTEYVNNTPATVEGIAVVLTFAQTLHRFDGQAPTKLKFAELSDSDFRRFCHYDILEEAREMGSQTVWKLAEWVEAVFELTNSTLNFSKDQIHALTRHGDELAQLDETFVQTDFGVGNRTMGYLREHNIIEIETDGRNRHFSTEWTLSDRTELLFELYEAVK